MKPLVKWSGGKAKEIDTFKSYFPKGFSTYVEPFFGGGAVFWDLCPSKSIISDVHVDLINFYNQIKQGNGRVIHYLMSKYHNSEEDYYNVRDRFEPANDIERAFQFFYIRKTSFRGMIRYNSKGGFNIPYGRYKNYNYDELLDEKYPKVLKNTTILNNSFEDVFKEYNASKYFYFLDPPYDSEFTNFGSSFGKEDHERLAKCFKETKSKCLLVIGETDFIRSLYDGYIKKTYHKSYAFRIHSSRVTSDTIDNNHLIIANY